MASGITWESNPHHFRTIVLVEMGQLSSESKRSHSRAQALHLSEDECWLDSWLWTLGLLERVRHPHCGRVNDVSFVVLSIGSLRWWTIADLGCLLVG
jgi:hypothetical protein